VIGVPTLLLELWRSQLVSYRLTSLEAKMGFFTLLVAAVSLVNHELPRNSKLVGPGYVWRVKANTKN